MLRETEEKKKNNKKICYLLDNSNGTIDNYLLAGTSDGIFYTRRQIEAFIIVFKL